MTEQIETEEKGKFKSVAFDESSVQWRFVINMPRYPYIATEVLCCEIWSIVDTCVNEQQQLLVPFWEVVLDKSPDDMKTQTTMASHFAKVNSVFMTKKPAEVSWGFLGEGHINIKHPLLRCWNLSKLNLQSWIVYLDISNCLLL